ncbi:protein translocase subunit SecD [Microbacterium sp. STN6]|uniref:protein translocase subunit SecD n=1 Tax=Microbacterium sp. STN6 TaxID=2995588 RepID=UPI002260DA94|nr:protein translocase subunit SecD [Microbacterium sp. STN6]MCX7521716.1 protein translocase subunit SecD [Microbacterium sp. STN6]
MAKSSPVKKAWRSLTWLGVIVVALVGILVGGVLLGGATWMPKLGLDLEGGTEIILAPQLEHGKTVSKDELSQAVSIIRQRVDASGVSEAQVSTQGDRNVVVSIPGPLDDATRQRIQASSKMELRPVLLTEASSTSSVGDNGSSATPAPTPTPTQSLSSTPTSVPTNGSDLAWITPALKAKYDAFNCAKDASGVTSSADPKKPLVTCDDAGQFKYILGPVEVDGSTISNASAGLMTSQSGVTTGEWAVNVSFAGKGKTNFAKVSKRLYAFTQADTSGTDPRARFAFVIDGKVLEAPTMNGAITDGNAQISGSFTETSAKTLANQLKFGALPVSFKVQSQNTISATLGSSQLETGLLAGLIGLALVVIYTLFQYRLLGFVTITSLVGAAVLTYLIIAILSWRIDYRLSLAGVAGLIVAIGFTADSFIVYFERIRDELREGRGLESAVEAGWKRAKRTIYASKATNLLAAVVLYVLAVGNVQGFAFTLGVTTVIDVLVVILFTHPTLQLLAQTKFFASGHKLSGLDPDALGALYRGAAQFRAPAIGVKASAVASSSREAAKRQTIAERKAELASANSGGSDRTNDGKDS